MGLGTLGTQVHGVLELGKGEFTCHGGECEWGRGLGAKAVKVTAQVFEKKSGRWRFCWTELMKWLA